MDVRAFGDLYDVHQQISPAAAAAAGLNKV